MLEAFAAQRLQGLLLVLYYLASFEGVRRPVQLLRALEQAGRRFFSNATLATLLDSCQGRPPPRSECGVYGSGGGLLFKSDELYTAKCAMLALYGIARAAAQGAVE